MLGEKRTLLHVALMILLCAGIITVAVALEIHAPPAMVIVPEKTPTRVTLDQTFPVFS
jgi:hypothetical protein